jgi:hypothetical protein
MPTLSADEAALIAEQVRKQEETPHGALFAFSKAVLDRLKTVEKRQVSLAGPTLRDVLLESKELANRPKELLPGAGVKLDIERKATLTGVTAQVFSGSPVIAGLPIIPTPLRSLFRIVPTTAGAVQVVRKTSYTSSAAAVAEGALKPEASAAVDVTPRPVEKIAVWIKTSKETYDDLPALIGEIESELMGDVNLEEERQLLKGNGTSPNLTGIYPAAPAMTALPGGTSYIDQIGAGLGRLISLGYAPNGIVVNGEDWHAAKMSKMSTGEYLFGNPSQAVGDRLWGLRVVTSSHLATTEWIAGDFQRGAELHERESVGVSVAMMDQDDFIRNLVTLLAELREVLVIKQAAAFIKNGTVA